jgi:TnpA family transposase
MCERCPPNSPVTHSEPCVWKTNLKDWWKLSRNIWGSESRKSKRILRVAGSLKMGTGRASELIRSLHRGGRVSTLGRAVGELGRIPKALRLLNFIADPNYRRHILNQLNRGEGRGRISRKVFHGQRGELRQRYREGQEQLGTLGLVVNVLILRTTRYMDAALGSAGEKFASKGSTGRARRE